jgi:hypothetical protein
VTRVVQGRQAGCSVQLVVQLVGQKEEPQGVPLEEQQAVLREEK